MKLTDGDYSDLVTYLTGLFQKKNMRHISIDRYGIDYHSCFVIDDLGTLDGHQSHSYPSSDEKDRIKSIRLKVTGINGRAYHIVDIGWDSVTIEPDVHPKLAREFVDVLDRSTFRYF